MGKRARARLVLGADSSVISAGISRYSKQPSSVAEVQDEKSKPADEAPATRENGTQGEDNFPSESVADVPSLATNMEINEIKLGKFAFLGFGSMHDVLHCGHVFPTVHHAVSWEKYGKKEKIWPTFIEVDPKGVVDFLEKHAREDRTWESRSLQIIEKLLRDKFIRHSDLRLKLSETGNRSIMFNDDYSRDFDSSKTSKIISSIRHDINEGNDVNVWCDRTFEVTKDPSLRPIVHLHSNKEDTEDASSTTQELPRSRCSVLLGKLDFSDVKLQHASISRRHAILVYLPSSQIGLVDLNSKAGTLVNGVPVPPYEMKVLSISDKIQFGTSSRKFALEIDPSEILSYLEKKQISLEREVSKLGSSVDKPAEATASTHQAKIYIANLPFGCTRSELIDLFSSCGQVQDVVLPQNKSTFRSGKNTTGEAKATRGIGFVQFTTPPMAINALNFDGTAFKGRSLQVMMAEVQNTRRPPTMKRRYQENRRYRSPSSSGRSRSGSRHRSSRSRRSPTPRRRRRWDDKKQRSPSFSSRSLSSSRGDKPRTSSLERNNELDGDRSS